MLAYVEHVAQNLTLGGAKIAGDRPRILGVVDGLFDLLAKRRLGILAPDEVLNSPPQARTGVVLPGRHQAETS